MECLLFCHLLPSFWKLVSGFVFVGYLHIWDRDLSSTEWSLFCRRGWGRYVVYLSKKQIFWPKFWQILAKIRQNLAKFNKKLKLGNCSAIFNKKLRSEIGAIGAKECIVVISARAFQQVYTSCKIWLRYSRERAF